ncbi:hypothetical protein GCM10025876_37530 [Demequina litorisediminis]|uniref:Single-stranded DNA-binding protein n=1 Tax=Demequina litorisediminis TaxID=1849022 RepID=A0ABQ6IIK3_9MICO|nr:hypothetical protein GCM10025876_37530 [Demequina litorisediminis]
MALTATERAGARLYVRVGQEHFQRGEDGLFTPLEPTFHDLVVFGRTADRAVERTRRAKQEPTTAPDEPTTQPAPPDTDGMSTSARLTRPSRTPGRASQPSPDSPSPAPGCSDGS